MNFVPILTRELRCREYQRIFRRQRFGTAAIAAAGLIAVIIIDQWVGGINVARLTLIGPLVGIVPFMLFVLGLNGAGPLVSTERSEGTLPLLILTRLNGLEIILGKLLQSLFAQVTVFLAALPALVLPMLAFGFDLTEAFFLTLALLNLLFFSLALGLLGAVLGDARVAASWCLFFFLPILAYSTPFVLFVPGGTIRDLMMTAQCINPCDAAFHAQSAAIGIRPGGFWTSLIVSHLVGWCFVIAAGLLLPRAVRWQQGVNARRSKPLSWFKPQVTPRPLRRRLLERNPFLWLNSRDRLATALLWLWLLLPAAGWSWLIWTVWSMRALNVAIVFVIAIALSWFVTLLIMIPTNACRQLVADRTSGALELVLCTPVTVESIARGIWLSLRRMFLLPVILVLLLSTLLMLSGYVTSGFGGMLDPEDFPFWLATWSTGIFLLPLALFTLCWVSMRRSLFARNVGEASAIAFLQVFGTIGLIEACIGMLSHSNSPGLAAIQVMTAIAVFLAFARNARRTFMTQFRPTALNGIGN